MSSDTKPQVRVEDDLARELLREMVRLRTFDEAVEEQFEQGEFPGNPHLCYGHEGTHAALGAAIEDDDWWAVGGARQDTQFLARGLSPKGVMAEIYGKETGLNRGKSGPMHASNVEENFYGHAATIGSGQNPAAGFALAQKYHDTGNVVVCTVGDGGTNRGSFHTALIIAAMWDLPVVYVVDNNQFAVSVSRNLLPPEHLSDYGEPVGMETESVDGTDAFEAYEAIAAAVERARNGGGPSVIESKVYRLAAHSGHDDESIYRDMDEKERQLEKGDPVRNLKERLIGAGELTEAEYEDMVETGRREAQDAVEFARESDYPDPEEAYEDVYVRPLYGQGGE
jgi:pyruvate dehydrogenase E1 component alpha subunit